MIDSHTFRHDWPGMHVSSTIADGYDLSDGEDLHSLRMTSKSDDTIFNLCAAGSHAALSYSACSGTVGYEIYSTASSCRGIVSLIGPMLSLTSVVIMWTPVWMIQL